MTAGATISRAILAAAILAAAFAHSEGRGRVTETDERSSGTEILFQAAAIDHNRQRYDTVGDWQQTPTTTALRISRLSDRRYEILVALHELIEAELCRHRGIDQHAITAFDEAFEKKRQEEIARLERMLGQAIARPGHTRQQVSAIKTQLRKWQDAEPGDQPDAPYREEHQFAYRFEKQLARELGVDWKAYEAEILELDWHPESK